MAFLAFLAGPIGRWLIITAIVAAAVFATYAKVKRIGWDERDAQARLEQAEADKRSALLAARREEVTERVRVEYRDRKKAVEGETREVIREVEKLIPADVCLWPPAWRVLHDAAAAGRFSEPPERASARAAPVDAVAAAETVAANYGACRANAEQLKALQAWVRLQEEANR